MTTSALVRRSCLPTLFAVLALAACATNPATGRRQLSLVSEAQEIQIGQESDPAITAQMGGAYPDSAVQRYVRGIGLRLAASSERPSLPWSVKLLDDDLVNAFALPGGYVYITRGILGHMNSEAELAAVLGHEIGHVTARHSAAQMTRAQLGQLGLGIGMIVSETVRKYGQAVSTGMQLLFLKYGRDDEREADQLGFRYMTNLRYQPRGMTDVMRMLNSTSAADQAGMPAWRSTHPDPGDRVAANEQRIAQANADFSGYALNRDAFLQHLDGMVYGADPRAGYFIGTRFLQPTLRFELTFPAGWVTQNGAQAVQAVSPGKDAALQLSFAQAASAAEALSKFAAAQGVTVSGSSAQALNGLPARRAEFDMQTESGVLHGLMLFVEYGGSVYQVVGYAPTASWSTHAATLGPALASFRGLADARYLDVAPNRIQIVRLPAAMNFGTFLQRYPSSLPADEIRLINQVAASEQLPAGRLLKRVTGGRVPTQ
ncbi:MAG: peptidase M48 [Gemmatimonadetes bacterium]|nr:peptidase M48 [Gemmatimonadota bacterium]